MNTILAVHGSPQFLSELMFLKMSSMRPISSQDVQNVFPLSR